MWDQRASLRECLLCSDMQCSNLRRACRAGDAARVIALGLGPMGCAFYLWSYALRRGDPRLIGVLANATPLLSTTALVLVGGNQITPSLMASLALVSCASFAVFASSFFPRRALAIASGPSVEVVKH
jgi:EamA-like transporter family